MPAQKDLVPERRKASKKAAFEMVAVKSQSQSLSRVNPLQALFNSESNPEALKGLQRTPGNRFVARQVALTAPQAAPNAVFRLPAGPELDRCIEWLSGKEDPESPQPLTDHKASTTLYSGKVAKRFVAADGTVWGVMIHFNRRALANKVEAQRYVHEQAEREYRKRLRYARSLARQRCEQMTIPAPPKPSPKQEHRVTLDYEGGEEGVRPASEGHTDLVPMRRFPGKRFKSLAILSDRRANHSPERRRNV